MAAAFRASYSQVESFVPVSLCVQYPLAISKAESYFALPHALPYQHLSPVLGFHLVVLVVAVALSTSPMSRPGVLVL